MTYSPLVGHLLQTEQVQPYQVEALQKGSIASLEAALLAAKLVTVADLLAALQTVYQVPAVYLAREEMDADTMNMVPPDIIRNCKVLPLRRDGDRVVVAMVDPSDILAEDFVRVVTGLPVIRVAVLEFDLEKFIDNGYKVDPKAAIGAGDLAELPTEVVEEKPAESEDRLDDVNSGPVVRLVAKLLSEAVLRKASDVHIEPVEDGLRVRYRIDGCLEEVAQLPQVVQSMVLSRIKLSSDIDISERRKPQDGRLRMQLSNKVVDFRVSTLPTYFGEKIVLRILDKSKGNLRLEDFGMVAEDLETFVDFLRFPQGMILITGPTGSGKTSTLYGALSRLHTPNTNIVTVEDPVEYQISGINQVQVNNRAGLTFANALRAILRQDPNVVMIGEIRDLETASIAFEAAMTGHLVLSTLHTNDAPSAIPRLLHLGLPGYMVASSLLGVVAQRLVRRLCADCRKKSTPTAEQKDILSRSGLGSKKYKYFVGKGCGTCDGAGYRGRYGLYEIVRMTEEVKACVFAHASEQDIRNLARRQGTHTLLEDGLRKCDSGDTSLEEVLKVAPAGFESGLVDLAAAHS